MTTLPIGRPAPAPTYSPEDTAAHLPPPRVLKGNQPVVSLRCSAPALRQPVVAALEALGIGTAPAETDGAPELWVVTDYTDRDLMERNRLALSDATPWLVLQIGRGKVLVGPQFTPGHGACLECLTHRVARWRQYQRLVGEKVAKDSAGSVAQPVAIGETDIARSCRDILPHAGKLLRQWSLNGALPSLSGRIAQIGPMGLTSYHEVTHRPQCECCGELIVINQPLPGGLALTAHPIHVNETGHRVTSSASTFARLKRHISPITGIVDRLLAQPDGTRLAIDGAPVFHSYSGGYNMTFSQGKAYYIKGKLQSRSGGKGLSEIQAKTSALCESIERYAGVYQGNEYFIISSYADMAAGEAIDPTILAQYSLRQYQEHGGRTRHAGKQAVTLPFDSGAAMEWTPVWSLSEERYQYVPASYCYYGHPDIAALGMLRADSNGSASGNTIEEAIVQGFLELVERDAVGIWWYNRLRRPAVDLDSFNLPLVDAMRALFGSLSRSLEVLDLTHDFGIPVFAAVSADTGRATSDILYGFGAHFSPRIALNRALLELGQSLPFVRRTDEEGKTRYGKVDAEAVEWWQKATLDSEPYLVGDTAVAASRDGDWKDFTAATVLDEVNHIRDVVRSRGLEILVHDQSQPDIDLACVKVIVPGMRHFWRRLGPGRLYDVPVQMGWRDRPLAEHELNPWSIHI